MTTSAQLSTLTLPTVDGDWSGWLADRCTSALADAARLRSEIASGTTDPLQSWNDLLTALANVFAVSSLVSQVHPDQAVREQAEAVEVEANAFRTDLMMDAQVFRALGAVDPAGTDAGGRRVLTHTLRDFRRAGVDRDDATRARLAALQERELELGQAFGRGIRDDKRTAKVPVNALDGLPADWIEAHPADADGLVTVTTDYPDVVPFQCYATDADARRTVTEVFLNRGWPDNDSVLSELLQVRHEHAQLLGYDDWPSFDAEVKMIGSGPAIGEFIDGIAADARAAGERELAVLLATAQAHDPQVEAIDTSNSRYWAEIVQRERFGVDAQRVREYFDFARVRQGLLDVTGRLFGLTWTPVDAPSWHADVTSYDVSLGSQHLGRIHLDLHPRDGKYNHAAQFDLVPGRDGVQLAEGVLVCNFPRGLMEHGDVVTLFHEFGHLVHHMLAGRHAWIPFSGVATEWDFVEAPSQMLEEWAWDADVLRGFALNAAGEPIPVELVEQMRAAEEFGKAYRACTQTFYAAVSYRLHLERPADLTARVAELQAAYSLIEPIADTHFHTGFGHLDGYSSGYYTYKWSLVIAKDLFSAFDTSDLFAPEVATRYRDLVLAAGGSKDAADLVEDFLGRPYAADAFKAWLADDPMAAS